MKRNVFFIVFLLACFSLAIWFHQTSVRTVERTLTVPSSPVERIATEPISTNEGDRTIAAQDQAQQEETRQQLTQEKQELERLRQDLDNLKSQQAQQVEKRILSYPTRISQDNQRIENMMSLLREHRLAEDDVNKTAQDYLREQSSAAQLAYEQIEQAIRSLEDSRTRTQEQIDYWNSFPPLVQPDQKAEYERLQNLKATLEQELQDLRAQKVQLSMAVLERTRAIHQMARQTKEDLIANENLIQDEIFSARNEITQIQQEQNRIRLNSGSLTEQMRKAQNDYQEQERKVKELEASLSDHNTETR